MNESIKLWGAGTARTLRPIWMAEELEINYELIPIGPRTGETQTEEFIQKLFKHNIILTHFVKRKESLEEQFLQLTDQK